MAAKRKKRRLKTSFKLFVAFFVLIISVFTLLMCRPKKQVENVVQFPPDTSLDRKAPIESFENYNEFIDIRVVEDTEVRRYPVLKGHDGINAKINEYIDLLPCEVTVEKAYFNYSYFSAVLFGKDGNIYTVSYSIADESKVLLSEIAPNLYAEYGSAPFYIDGDSVTVYTADGEKRVLFSEYDGRRHLPYCPPEYNPVQDGDKVIALTFDDGPARSDITHKILDKLAQRRAKATFFVLGWECPDDGDVLKRITEIGCEIGNHSWKHEKLNKLTRAEALDSINKTQDIVYQKTGVYPKIMRPPYGDEREDIMEELGLFHVEWCVDPEDWKVKDADAIVQHVKEKAKPGYIVLMHDIYDASGDAAEELIDWFCDNGWRLVTISELLDLENREFTTEIFRMK